MAGEMPSTLWTPSVFCAVMAVMTLVP